MRPPLSSRGIRVAVPRATRAGPPGERDDRTTDRETRTAAGAGGPATPPAGTEEESLARRPPPPTARRAGHHRRAGAERAETRPGIAQDRGERVTTTAVSARGGADQGRQPEEAKRSGTASRTASRLLPEPESDRRDSRYGRASMPRPERPRGLADRSVRAGSAPTVGHQPLGDRDGLAIEAPGGRSPREEVRRCWVPMRRRSANRGENRASPHPCVPAARWSPRGASRCDIGSLSRAGCEEQSGGGDWPPRGAQLEAAPARSHGIGCPRRVPGRSPRRRGHTLPGEDETAKIPAADPSCGETDGAPFRPGDPAKDGARSSTLATVEQPPAVNSQAMVNAAGRSRSAGPALCQVYPVGLKTEVRTRPSVAIQQRKGYYRDRAGPHEVARQIPRCTCRSPQASLSWLLSSRRTSHVQGSF